MADEIKFTEDELKSLNELRETYGKVQADFGALKVRRLVLDQQLEELDNAEEAVHKAYTDNQETERKLVEELNEKYGPGSLNPETGVFTPTPQPEAEEAPAES
jgi:chromosome segregation ATPase